MKPWITERITEYLKFEDEVVVGLVLNLLEEENVDPRLIMIQLTPFLEANTVPFMTELWKALAGRGGPSRAKEGPNLSIPMEQSR